LSTWNLKMDGERLAEITKVRDLDVKFEKKQTSRSTVASIGIRVPKKQKINSDIFSTLNASIVVDNEIISLNDVK
jgi:hypothetical protein